MRSFVTDSLFLSNTTAGKLIERTHSEPLSLRYLVRFQAPGPTYVLASGNPRFPEHKQL